MRHILQVSNHGLLFPACVVRSHPVSMRHSEQIFNYASRSVARSVCRVCGIDVEERSVKIGKQEQQSPRFLAVNPLGKLPCLQVHSLLPHVLRGAGITCRLNS